jgi:hypothetical protein
MKYRFMRVENVILPLHPLTPGDTPHRDDRSRYMLIFGIGILAIATTVLLVILLSEKAGSYSQVAPHTMTPSNSVLTSLCYRSWLCSLAASLAHTNTFVIKIATSPYALNKTYLEGYSRIG